MINYYVKYFDNEIAEVISFESQDNSGWNESNIPEDFEKCSEEVVIGYDGKYYKKSQLPQKPKDEITREEIIFQINQMQQYLSDTDWYVTRSIESKKAVPEEVRLKRKEYRDNISKLRLKIL